MPSGAKKNRFNWYDAIVYSLLLLFTLLTLVPFLFVVGGSFASTKELLEKGVVLFPTQFSLDGYKYIFSTSTFITSLLVTVWITVSGTAVNLVMTILTAYPLSKSELKGQKICMMLIVFSMIFSGGMIPTYLVVKAFGMLDSYWSLIIPGAISGFNLIVIRNFFQQLPEGLEESAKIDGYNDLQILFRIVLPLSMPVIATFALFYAVGHWNTYFNAILYITDSAKWPIQVLLRQIVILSMGGIGDSNAFDVNFVPPAQTVKLAAIVVATVPILLIYPFLQRHFTQGMMLGAMKG
ncbi:carbohydrate ABC transporter permease [Cohnella abietis]|uniref:Putative ABC transporter permease protein YtcP n=1 Tax=Cohnella abietis TaxID=2507935 RepID=A0A3T1DEI5_9BACL|nr:carbohydrate ABC transporter permease [Cohnella abietis]BBI36503.1 putative ABC transporter permease protein YtcP [Cohnella abietis]